MSHLMRNSFTWLQRQESRDGQGNLVVAWSNQGTLRGHLQLRLPDEGAAVPHDRRPVSGRLWLSGHLAVKVGDRLQYGSLRLELRALLPAAGARGLQQARVESLLPEAS